jgi:hypothetical protein
MMADMKATENERPWAIASQALRMSWVQTDDGLRMRWEMAESPKPERIFVLHTDIPPIAA